MPIKRSFIDRFMDWDSRTKDIIVWSCIGLTILGISVCSYLVTTKLVPPPVPVPTTVIERPRASFDQQADAVLRFYRIDQVCFDKAGWLVEFSSSAETEEEKQFEGWWLVDHLNFINLSNNTLMVRADEKGESSWSSVAPDVTGLQCKGKK